MAKKPSSKKTGKPIFPAAKSKEGTAGPKFPAK